MNQEDAEKFLVSYIRQPLGGGYSNYGYDIYMSNVIGAYFREQSPNDNRDHHNSKEAREASPEFLAAAWDLCRRGIIRPGVKVLGAQSTDDGAAGAGFSITPFGRKWLSESDRDDYVPTEPGRFAQMFEPTRNRIGPLAYHRAQEAIRCYGAHCYLACAAMCGAAAESILLAVTIARVGDQEKVLKAYNGAAGRSRVETLLLGQATDSMRRGFSGLTALLKYWRDSAAHGHIAEITDNEAHTSLALLLRFALFVDDNWDELTKR
jgi:hypothetical protein